jgi:hypothetical protein
MLTTCELRRNLITMVIEEWAKKHAFKAFTESLIVNTLTRELNNLFRFTVFVLIKNNRSFEVHYQIDDNHELQVIEFKVNYEN